MSFEDIPYIPVAQIDPKKFEKFDGLIDSILDGIGEKAAALTAAAVVKGTDAVANGAERVATSAAAPFDNSFIANGSPMERGATVEAGKGRGRDVTDNQQVGSSQSENVGAPTQGRNASEVYFGGATHVPDEAIVSPNVNFNKGPSQGQGMDGP